MSRVSTNTDDMVAGQNAGTKLDKARKPGTSILNDAESHQFIGNKEVQRDRTSLEARARIVNARLVGPGTGEPITVKSVARYTPAPSPGEWQLRREEETLGGNFTLAFRRLDGQWVIIHDHTSLASGAGG